MATAALDQALSASGAVMGEYCGAETAARFSSVAAEYEALRSGCALYDLGWRSKLTVTGGDRVRWLNGMVTNNIRDLGRDRGVYCFLLNAQGRILGDMYAYNRADYLLLDSERGQQPALLAIFDKFIIMDDVEVHSADARLTALGLSGPRALPALEQAGVRAAGLQALEVRDAEFRGFGISCVRGEWEHSYEIWMAPEHAALVWQALAAAGATPAGCECLELARITRGLPRFAQDIRGRELPQETGQLRALNFQKGCYLGQEIVERIHSRAIIHRQFAGFELSGPLPAAGAKIEVEGKAVGEVTSAAQLPGPNGGRAVALGYIRREAGMPGAQVEIAGSRARVAALPFEKL